MNSFVLYLETKGFLTLFSEEGETAWSAQLSQAERYDEENARAAWRLFGNANLQILTVVLP